ncbi:MAG: DUF4358 domain-containing protein [Lachnospiraceae bacterium]|nr:DUF4358 domain-containing protein [Lachnospiraceae bacterium]
MKKAVLFELLCSILLVGILAAVLYEKPVKDVPLSAVEAAFADRSDFRTMEKFGAMTLRRNLSLDEADLPEYLYYGQSDTMAVQVFFVAKSASETVREAVSKAVDRYLEREKKAYLGYGASQTALLNDARIVKAGDYVAFIVSADADAWEAEFRSLITEE